VQWRAARFLAKIGTIATEGSSTRQGAAAEIVALTLIHSRPAFTGVLGEALAELAQAVHP
jgi:hypothetical protein